MSEKRSPEALERRRAKKRARYANDPKLREIARERARLWHLERKRAILRAAMRRIP